MTPTPEQVRDAVRRVARRARDFVSLDAVLVELQARHSCSLDEAQHAVSKADAAGVLDLVLGEKKRAEVR